MNNSACKGPGAVISTGGQQILVMHGTFYVRVHLYNVQLRD